MSRLISKYYTIKYGEKIGVGLTGNVYKAVRKTDGEICAVKILRRNALDGAIQEAVDNETKALSILDHSNICRVLDSFEDRVNFYIVLEFINGDQLLSKIASYNEADMKLVSISILNALQHCHGHDVVHRDIKCENVLIQRDCALGNIKLIDFGFAKFAADLSLTGRLGTPFYMAPEIWSGRPYGKPVDMWAFGVMIYILLCGRPPFFDPDHSKLVEKIQRGELEFPDSSSSSEAVSAACKEFITLLLQVEVDRRMTAEEALEHRWVWRKKDTFKFSFQICADLSFFVCLIFFPSCLSTLCLSVLTTVPPDSKLGRPCSRKLLSKQWFALLDVSKAFKLSNI